MAENKPPNTGGQSSDEERITIQVVNQNGHELNYRVRKWTKMSTLMSHYAKRMQTTADQLIFIYNGEILIGGETAESLGMVPENEIIEIYPRSSQVGGVAH